VSLSIVSARGTAAVLAARRRALDHRRFDPSTWERRRRRRVDRAFAEVLLYREQWAVAGRVLDEPTRVRAADLAEELYRLCPIARPWNPTREPSLWIGSPSQLRDVLTLAEVLDPDRPDRPVLEVRQAVVDWPRLGRWGPPYAALLGPTAPVADEARRRALALPAWTLALAHGGAIVVGSTDERAAFRAEAQAVLGGIDLRWDEVDRASLAAAAESSEPGPLVVQDPYLGYLAARLPSCGRVHLLWSDVHCRETPGGLVFTRLRTSRPTLVNIIPVDPGFTRVAHCPTHGTPILSG
jgi:hypothetical protein